MRNSNIYCVLTVPPYTIEHNIKSRIVIKIVASAHKIRYQAMKIDGFVGLKLKYYFTILSLWLWGKENIKPMSWILYLSLFLLLFCCCSLTKADIWLSLQCITNILLIVLGVTCPRLIRTQLGYYATSIISLFQAMWGQGDKIIMIKTRTLALWLPSIKVWWFAYYFSGLQLSYVERLESWDQTDFS